jgi:hypothetical protein
VFVNPRVAQPGAGEAGYSSVATPGVGVAAGTVDAARDDERPPPRQP